MVDSATGVAHGTCVGVDSGLDLRGGYSQHRHRVPSTMFFYRFGQRYTEIKHDPLLFSVAHRIFWLSTESLSRSTLHLKEGGGERGVCTLVLCSLATLMSCIDASVRIVTKSPEGRTSTYILHIIGFCLCYWSVANQWKASSDLTVASPPLGVKGDPVRVETLIVPPSHHLRQDMIVNRKTRIFFLVSRLMLP